MPKWTQLAPDTLKFHPYQDAFWAAQKLRICTVCSTEWSIDVSPLCLKCAGKPLRKFHRFSLISGRRGGKTLAGSVAVVSELTKPNSVWWACAPTNPKLHRYVIPAFQKLIPESWVKNWSSEYLDLTLTNGSLLHFQTLEDPDQGRGQGLDGVWIDEASELTADHWHVLRPSLTERRGIAILTTSPRSYDWVWEEFYHKAELQTQGYWACRYATSENPIIDAAELAEAKASMPPAMFQQEFMADFVIFTGAVYGGLVDPQILHTTEQVKALIPEWPDLSHYQTLVGIDTGADHPFGAVKLVVTTKGLVCVGEYLERNRSFIQHAYSIKTLAGSPLTKYAINKNERQPMIELAQHGINCQPAQNDVIAGIQRVSSWLHARQLYFVQDYCPLTVRQLKAYRWADDKAKDGSVRKEKVYKKEDELPDCLRYALMSWPILPKTQVESSPIRNITNLPLEMQATIVRMRKTEPKDPDSTKDMDELLSQGNFWGSQSEDTF